MERFTEKVAIVTGASTGVGPVMAKMLADEGAKVVVAARRLELIERVAADIGSAAVAIRTDVSDEADVAAMVDAAMSRWGRVDILMNNAAVPGTDMYVWEETLENWNATIAVDVTAAMLCSREVLRRSMLERRSGVIVNFSTGAAWTGMVRKSHYSVAKVGLHALTKVIALEAGPFGIRCNCVVPGVIDTELFQNYVQRVAAEEGIDVEQKRSSLVAESALKVPSTPEDVANLALFLASDQAQTITGQSIAVDAGHVMMGDNGRMDNDTQDYIAIAQLQRRYADISTRRAWSEVVSIATPDARFSFDTRHGLYEIEGAAAFAEAGAQLADRFTFSNLIPVNFVVTFSPEGTADGRSYCLEVAQERDTGEWIEHYGLYNDQYALFEEAWRFSRRHYRTLARRVATGPAEIFPLDPPI